MSRILRYTGSAEEAVELVSELASGGQIRTEGVLEEIQRELSADGDADKASWFLTGMLFGASVADKLELETVE